MKRALTALALALSTGCIEDGASCFAGGTMIATPRGPRAIRDLVVGDEVWSYDHVTRRFAIGTVTAIHRARGEIRSIRTAAGVLAAVTASHPLFVADQSEFVAARTLENGAKLLHWNGDPEAAPRETEVLGFDSPAPGDTVEVFNLTVGDAFSTFFADGFFGHNKTVPLVPCTATSRVTVDAPTEICVGWKSDIRLFGSCATSETTILATSDPAVLVTEGLTATGVGVGAARIDVLIDGRKVGEHSMVVSDCTKDGGADAAPDDTDASSDTERATD